MKTLEKEGVPGSQAPHLSSQQKPSLQGHTRSLGGLGLPGGVFSSRGPCQP